MHGARDPIQHSTFNIQHSVLRIALSLTLAALTIGATSQGPPPSARAALGSPRGVPLTGGALEAEAQQVASLLRCPVCQGLSIDDSPAPMARNMSLEVRDLLAAGYDREQVLEYFENSYGEFVLLQPPLRGVNWIVWLAPLLVLLAGAATIFVTLRKMRAGAGAANAHPLRDEADSTDVDDAELERYLAAARQLASEDQAVSGDGTDTEAAN